MLASCSKLPLEQLEAVSGRHWSLECILQLSANQGSGAAR